MLYTTIARVDEHDVPRLRAWLDDLDSRRDELRGSYRQQGTRQEQFFLVRTRESPILVIVSEVEDALAAAESFLHSELPIDVEFKALVQAISPEEADVELVYDSSRYIEIGGA